MYIKKFKYNSVYAIWESVVKSHIAFHKLSIPEQQIKCLVVFCMYGIKEETYDIIVEKNIVPKKSIIRNYKTFLKENGLIVKKRSNEWEVCEDLKNLDVSKGVEIKVKIDLANGITK